MTHDALLTPAQVGNILNITAKQIRTWADSGALACIRTRGGHRRYFASDIQAQAGYSRAKLLKMDEASKMLGVSKSTLVRCTLAGRLSHVRLPSNHRRFRIEDLEALGAELQGERIMPSEAARILGISKKALDRRARNGKISYSQTVAGHRRYLRSEIELLAAVVE